MSPEDVYSLRPLKSADHCRIIVVQIHPDLYPARFLGMIFTYHCNSLYPFITLSQAWQGKNDITHTKFMIHKSFDLQNKLYCDNLAAAKTTTL